MGNWARRDDTPETLKSFDLFLRKNKINENNNNKFAENELQPLKLEIKNNIRAEKDQPIIRDKISSLPCKSLDSPVNPRFLFSKTLKSLDLGRKSWDSQVNPSGFVPRMGLNCVIYGMQVKADLF